MSTQKKQEENNSTNTTTTNTWNSNKVNWVQLVITVTSMLVAIVYFASTLPTRTEMETKDKLIEDRMEKQYQLINSKLDILIQDRLSQK